MRIGVISDTHIPRAALDIPEEIYEEFKKVDLILHAGDLVELEILDRLKKLAPVKAVYGNMDDRSVRSALPEKEIIEVGKGLKIGLIHGSGAPSGLIQFVKSEFEKVDVIVFGHSHYPVNEIHDGVLFFNPGSPTDKIFASINTYGMLEVGQKIKGAIIRLK